MMGRSPICAGCTLYLRNSPASPRCSAFPAGIPEEILQNVVDHRKPYNGDRGLQFKPVSDNAKEYADFIFGEERTEE